MKLYYSRGACSLVPRIIINELGLASEYESVDLAKKITQSGQNYYEINAKGAVPAIQTNEGEVLTENAAILQFLADNAKAEHLLPSVGNFKRYKVLEWLNYITTELHKSFSLMFNPKLTDEIKTNVLMPIIKGKLSYVNSHLEKNKFLCGDEFTLPDAYFFVMLTWAIHFKIDPGEFPQISKYFSELQSRKSIQQSLHEEGMHFPKS